MRASVQETPRRIFDYLGDVLFSGSMEEILVELS